MNSFIKWIQWQIEMIKCKSHHWEKRNVDAGAWWYSCKKCFALTRNPKLD